ncbi:MAG: twin-arginine translocase subunit TatC [Deltaproteobacteria bacterium]|nr:twin-arginine translocase subunit TatC [Deltaproteobacteria bacterium]
MNDSQKMITDPNSGEMPLIEHLHELRKRFIYSFGSILICAGVAYLFSTEIFDLLSAPYYRNFNGSSLIGTGPAEAFLLKLKMAVAGGVVISSPILFLQLWLFIQPGLLEQEKKLALPFILSTTLLFLVGLWFCYSVVLPFAFEFFFQQYQSINVTPTVRIAEHVGFIAKALIAFGLIFEMPIVAFFLGKLRIINSKMLIGAFRYAIVAAFAIGAILTPPDVVTQLLMAGPLLILYGLSIVVVKMTEPKSSDEESA